MLTINTTTSYGLPFLTVHVQPSSQWKRFLVPVEGNRLLQSHDITRHVSFHWHDTCHYEMLEHVIVMITWRGNATIGRHTIFGLNHIMSYQLQILSLISFLCHSCMKSPHNTHNQIWKNWYGFYLNKEPQIHYHWDRDEIMLWFYVMILWVIHSFNFGQFVTLLKDHLT